MYVVTYKCPWRQVDGNERGQSELDNLKRHVGEVDEKVRQLEGVTSEVTIESNFFLPRCQMIYYFFTAIIYECSCSEHLPGPNVIKLFCP